MDEEDYKTKLGYSLVDVAKEARDLLFQVVGAELGEWDGVPEQVREQWLTFSEVIVEVCAREMELTWTALTEKAHTAFHGEETFAKESDLMKMVWQALCRHTVNLVTADDHEDLAVLGDSVQHWKEWVLERSGRHDGANRDGHGVVVQKQEEDPGEDWDGSE